jgi:hypothetical protein
MVPSIHLCRPEYTYVTLDTLKYVALDTFMSPGNTYVALNKLPLCRPRYTYVGLDTLMSY